MNVSRRAMLKSCPAAACTLGGMAALGAAAHEAPAPSRSVTVKAAEDLPAAEREEHERYMRLAIDEVRQQQKGPYGAVIVDRKTGEIACRAVGKVRESPILHAEMVAIDLCARAQRHRNWEELTLYTTAESCPMCMSGIVWTRIGQVVYGTSIVSLVAYGLNQLRLDNATVAGSAPFYSGEIVTGVLRTETDPIYENWAAERRARRQ